MKNHFLTRIKKCGVWDGPLSLADYVLMNYFVLMLNEWLEVKGLFPQISSINKYSPQ